MGFFDPCFEQPLVLATTIRCSAKTLFELYIDRWPVEQVPLVAKQRIGLCRQYVFNPECCWRLPELAILAGNMLTHVAHTLPPMPTGYWDRFPKKTAGRLQQTLNRGGRPEISQLDSKIRPKASISTHLPKGVAAHRRSKTLEAADISGN